MFLSGVSPFTSFLSVMNKRNQYPQRNVYQNNFNSNRQNEIPFPVEIRILIERRIVATTKRTEITLKIHSFMLAEQIIELVTIRTQIKIHHFRLISRLECYKIESKNFKLHKNFDCI